MVLIQIVPVLLPVSHFLGYFGQRNKLELILSSVSTFAEDLLGDLHPPCLHSFSGTSLSAFFYSPVTAKLRMLLACGLCQTACGL